MPYLCSGYDELVHGTLLRRLTQYVAARWQVLDGRTLCQTAR